MVLFGLFFVATLLRLLMWWLYPSIHQADEIFQYREQAFRLAEGFGVVPWEYLEGARSWVLPGFLAALRFATESLGLGLRTWHFVIAFALSLMSLSVVWVMASYGRWVWGTKGMVMAGGLGVVWFELLYFAPKTLTTPVATHILLFALISWGLGIERVSTLRLFGGGALAALSFVVRPQLLPAILVLGAWIAWRHRNEIASRSIVAGVLVGMGTLGLVDLLAYEYPFEWLVNSYRWQIAEGVFAQFGETAWYYYAAKLAESWGYLIVTMAVPIVVGVWRLPGLALGAAGLLFANSLLVHKEYRFIYGFIALALVLAAVGLVILLKLAAERHQWSTFKTATLTGALLLAVGAAGAQRSLSGEDPIWLRSAETIAAFDILQTDASLRSLALHEVEWWRTPGYSGLGKDVHIRIITDEELVSGKFDTYTHLLTTHKPHELSADFVEIPLGTSQEQTIHLYRSVTPYEEQSLVSLNEQLQIQWEEYKAGRSDRVNP